MLKKLLFSLAGICFSFSAFSTEPSGYYSSCENLNGAALLSALCKTVSSHTNVGYDGLWAVYAKSDITANGKLWDMYSTKEWPTDKSQRCGSYQLVGDCVNREHSFPKSWFSSSSPMYSDAFHIYPTDGKVNGQRSNYPYGECASGSSLPSNGDVKPLGKLGLSTFDGYSGTVFEPDDQYKGDFARSYFYMAAAYNNIISGWNSVMLANNAYPAFSQWALNLLLKWHRQDPVSQKELDRNEAIYDAQKNRNPFIDHPELAEYIWGTKTTELWSSSLGLDPSISLPVNNSVIDLGAVGVGVAHSTHIVVKGIAIKDAAQISVSGSGFTVNATTLSAASLNASEGTKITVTLTAPAEGLCEGSLSIVAGDASTTVKLTATAYNGLPASAPTEITSESFIAHWTYVGKEDSNGCYILYVFEKDGSEVDTYPSSIVAKDEQALVDALEPETTYIYYITNGELTSNVIEVTTGPLIPNIDIYHDGDLILYTATGVPSDAAELLLDAENIDSDITLSVKAPFELSSDKSQWSSSITISAEEDRFYIRINGDTDGVYQSEIIASSGNYSTDNAVVTGTISSTPNFIEDFEASVSTTYNTQSITGTAATWYCSNAGVWNDSSRAYQGINYARFGTNSDSYIQMATDKENGAGIVTLYASGWAPGDGDSKFDVEYSTDGGESWTVAGSVDLPAPKTAAKSYAPYSFNVNKAGKVRIKVQQTSGQRMCVDNISITDYFGSDGIDGVLSDYKSWDAYCRLGQLCIELSSPQKVAVYGVDGVTYLDGTLSAGTTTLSLAKGLYIVVVDDFSRRVLVK
jgi:endonuclease I